MKKLSVAVIGCGNIYRTHADALRKIKNVDLKYMVDNKEERAKKAASIYQCSYLTDFTELLDKEIDAAHICTPHYLHSQMAVELLEAGINVFIEKPLALNYEEGRKIIEAEKDSSAKLGVCFQNRFNANNFRAKKIIEKGNLGKVKGIKGIVTWHRDEKYYLKDNWKGSYDTEGGGVLINQAIHTLDLIQWFGGTVKAVKGNIDTRVLDDVIEVEDTAEATIFFESGAVGIFYTTNTFTDNSPIEIVIDCEYGSLRLFGDQLMISNTKESIKVLNEDNTGKYKPYWGGSHPIIIEKFYQDIFEDDYANTITAKEGLKSLKLIKYIYLSSKNRKKYFL